MSMKDIVRRAHIYLYYWVAKSPQRNRGERYQNAFEDAAIVLEEWEKSSLSIPPVPISVSHWHALWPADGGKSTRSRPLGIAMSESNRVQKYALMCQHLAAECRGLAADVPEPDLRARFVDMASRWAELADQPRVLH